MPVPMLLRCSRLRAESAEGLARTTADALQAGYGPTLVFRDPDNTQLELYVRPNLADLSLTDADSEAAREALQSG